jgi:hypothetical protein
MICVYSISHNSKVSQFSVFRTGSTMCPTTWGTRQNVANILNLASLNTVECAAVQRLEIIMQSEVPRLATSGYNHNKHGILNAAYCV